MTISKRSYARVNGPDLYYAIHGAGQPLVLLPIITEFLDAPIAEEVKRYV